ncbi:hypothetical protein PSECIP111854_00317 [Pseudoalteromonas sp. CIP111854]|uniref:Uncharacterized protein n=1 Tax=Pseudoalteromonas holothuriae TaxID=2963714 RepID=A0A9W4QRG7_9GAMM|nr:hypothetical protein [Pseudoalteromonas sp. CIP111854]CAH9049670.1 hypothetical protein PSECIP111854_00317 [Pseudoalteromonas sp. CIP111854]
MSLSDFLYYLWLACLGYGLLVVLWFVVTQFPKHRWSLLFARHRALKSLQLHEMHSCFISLVVFLLFYIVAAEVEWYLLSLELAREQHIRVFYMGMITQQFALLVVLYMVHRLRGCLFSITARICMYTTFLYSSFLFMQLVARGYFDYHELGMVYRIGGWACNIIAIAALSIYPIRQTLAYYSTRSDRK